MLGGSWTDLQDWHTGGTPLDDPHGRSAVFPGEEFLVGEGTGLSSHQHFPGTVAGF